MLKVSRGVKRQTQLICCPGQNLVRSRNLRKKLSLHRKGVPHPLTEEPGDRSCYRCLRNHDHKSCPFLKEKCHHCNKTGHIPRACKAKKRETQAAHPPIHYVDGDDGHSDHHLGSLEVNNVSDKDHVIWVSPEVKGRVIKIELDTG